MKNILYGNVQVLIGVRYSPLTSTNAPK